MRPWPKKIAELGLDVALTKTGCIGFCQREPLVDVVYPKKVRLTYQAMTPESGRGPGGSHQGRARFIEHQSLCRIDQEEFPGGRPGPALCQSAPSGIAAGVPQV